MLALLGLTLTVLSADVAHADPELGETGDRIVHLRQDVFGARIDTPLRIRGGQAARDPETVLDVNGRAFADLASWVEASAEAVSLDDYGRFRLVVAAVDALPIETRRGPGVQSVTEALEAGHWTPESRLLAVGGGLRALGVCTAVFSEGRRRVVLGVASEDSGLNVDAIEHRWRLSGPAGTREVVTRWLLWDGVQPLGAVDDHTRLRPTSGRPPTGRSLDLSDPRPPAFTLRRAAAPVGAMQGVPSVVRHPDAAGWMALSPERHLPSAVPAARDYVRRSGLLDAARRAMAGAPTESDRVDALIRFVQASFVYEPGPVRTLPELLERGRGDCDQLSLLLAALLLETGYAPADVVVVSWPDHLGLAVRPREGAGPDDAVALDITGGRYLLVDVTHYMWRNDRLVSRWGRTAPSHGTSVSVQRL